MMKEKVTKSGEVSPLSAVILLQKYLQSKPELFSI